jgi:hypothetical protein
VQADETRAAFRRRFQRRQSLFVLPNPLRPFGNEEHDTIGSLNQLRPVLPLAVGFHDRDVNFLDRLEDRLQDLEAIHVLVSGRRMAVWALTDEEELLWSVGEQGAARK